MFVYTISLIETGQFVAFLVSVSSKDECQRGRCVTENHPNAVCHFVNENH